ncbi:MAG: adenosine deaminase [Candidatus Eremiobacteraeota bacterium]|nr:adenosine deaminase [Candidatus Eremiobacteraeota bacterium]MBC5826185.1 adenosine deaminase [Candidatus Eremiobacteraeota bacterium]
MSRLGDWIGGLPKAELHVHLEGTITKPTLERIVRRNGMEFPAGDPFHCVDFASFLEAFVRVVRCLQQPVDFVEIVGDYLKRAADQGVKHVELMFSPATQRIYAPGLDLEAMIAAVHGVCAQADAAHGISSLLIVDVVRNLGEEAAGADLELALRCRKYGVAGIGLGGDERRFPAAPYAPIFQLARSEGLRRTAHAGEAAGAQSIVDAVTLLHAERIGHGVAAAGRPDVIALLKDRAVAIDACITSNSITGAVAPTDAHPLDQFLRSGLTATLSTDDPTFFRTSVIAEYQAAAGMGLRIDQLGEIARNGFRASFAAPERKLKWLTELDSYLATA